jgi:rSAM/selenodomain-associated transferase 1
MSADRGAICVLVKAPSPGRVKTRLARTLGNAAAAALAEAFLEDTVSALVALDVSVILAFDGEPPERYVRASVRVWNQGAGSLGDRVERVLARALESHRWAIALGADSPGLPPSRLADAMAALTREGGPPAVIGPCTDGGFYLLGVRTVSPGALDDVRWSTSHALEDTRAALARAGQPPHQLEPWFDVDEEADLTRLEALLASGAVSAPATAALLAHGRLRG